MSQKLPLTVLEAELACKKNQAANLQYNGPLNLSLSASSMGRSIVNADVVGVRFFKIAYVLDLLIAEVGDSDPRSEDFEKISFL